MSEHQYVHFIAIDRPLNDKELEYMRRQSTRAEITPWEFTNEYHYGDFRGNAEEMLRRGYDMHLHYANFGIRCLMIRLPGGLPCDRKSFKAYQGEAGLEWHADKNGKGGILEINPEGDESYDEDYFELEDLLSKLAPLREQLMAGDVRPLYLAWLVNAYDDDAREPPVPAGLGKLTPALLKLAEFYALDGDLIASAAERSPSMPATTDSGDKVKAWIARRSSDDLRELVGRLLGDDAGTARAETLARVRDESETTSWPTAAPTRTLGELREAAKTVREKRIERRQKADEAARRKRYAAIAADPLKVVGEVKKLVASRSTDNYQKAAATLVELREALGPDAGPARARSIAEELRRENPTLRILIGALKRAGLLG